MKTSFQLRLLLMALLVLPAISQADAVVNNLFTPLYKGMSGFSDSNKQSAFYESKEINSLHYVSANFSGLDENTNVIYFQLNPDFQVKAEKTFAYTNELGGLVWEGSIGNEDNSVLMVLFQEQLSATIKVADKVFQVSALDNLEHEIVEVNKESETPDHEESYYQQEAEEFEHSKSLFNSEQLNPPANNENATNIITVIVAYTRDVANGASLAQQGIALTNQGYRNSGVNASHRLVHVYRTPTSASDYKRDKADFRRKGDGRFDEIHRLRDQYGADVAVLITSRGSACGSAYINASASSGFTWVKNTCATHRLSFGHEIGHLYGARHNYERDPKGVRYGHGFCGTRGKRSIMSYSGSRCSNRVNYWSDPNKIVNGERFGNSRAHNARLLNENAPRLANFRRGAVASNQPPNAIFSYNMTGKTIKFTDKSIDSDGNITSRIWRFDDGKTSTSTAPRHTYSKEGTYSVSLTVTDNKGVSNTSKQSIKLTTAN